MIKFDVDGTVEEINTVIPPKNFEESEAFNIDEATREGNCFYRLKDKKYYMRAKTSHLKPLCDLEMEKEQIMAFNLEDGEIVFIDCDEFIIPLESNIYLYEEDCDDIDEEL